MNSKDTQSSEISFREKLLRTLRDIQEILPCTIIIGSEVPNLLQFDKKTNLFVSEDIDIGIPVDRFPAVKQKLPTLLNHFDISPDEPSILCPKSHERLEVNFLGIDSSMTDPDDLYIFEDDVLSFIVFGTFFMIEGQKVTVGNTELTVASPETLFVEKLLTVRSGIKGERDLVVAGLLLDDIQSDKSHHFIMEKIHSLRDEKKHLICDNLAELILMIEKGKYDIKTDESLLKKILGGVS